MSAIPSAVVVLVHGTFGRQSAWLGKKSTLTTEIRARLPGVSFLVFRWTGANSEAARATAARDLAGLLTALHGTLPTSRCYVLAHSHGGNVVRQALQQVEHEIAGVVTLATPFFDRKPRDLDLGLVTVATILMAALVGTYVVLVVQSGQPPRANLRLALAAVVTGLGLASLVVWVHAALKRKQEALLRAATWSRTTETPWLCIHPTNDEASFYLRALYRAGSLPLLFLSRPFLVGTLVLAAIVTAYFATSSGVSGDAADAFDVVPLFYRWSSGTAVRVVALVAMCIIVGLAVVAISAAASYLLMFVGIGLYAHGFGLGRAPGLMHLLVRVRVAISPAEHGVVTVSNASSSRVGLRHTGICSSAQALEIVGKWLGAVERGSNMNARTTLETSVVASTAADGWLSTCLAARGHSCAPQWTSTSDGDLASVDSATTTRFSARVVAGASAARAMSVTALLLALVVVFVLPWALILTSEFYLRGILLPRDDERSFVLMRRAADLGNVEAMTDLAKKFAIGEGTRIDYGAARRWYMLATDRGSTRAMLGLGAMAEQGQGEPVNRGKAAKLWGQAAALGNARAMFLLGARHQEGGSSSDLVQARQWYERSTAGGDRHGARALALMLSSGVGGPADVPRARTLLERTGAVLDLAALDQRGDNGPQGLVAARRTFEMAARFGSSVAMHNLGVMYETGRGAAKDANEAASWYLRAAKAGNKTSMRYLGSFYQAVEHLDYRAARLWHERAAELGNTDSMVDLGAMALYGRGGVQDYATSRRWFERAASGGNVLGLHNLGILHYNGQGVSRDMVAARGYFQKAAQRGSPHAMRQLASMYRHGQGVERRLATAVELYEKAAALGDTDAMVELGIMFSESFSAMRDARRARTWFERAASKGSARGARNLGVFYREGHGVTVDLAVARSWFEKAAAAGDGDAMNDLADLFLRGAGVRQDYVVAGQWRDRAAQLTETTTGMASLAANWTGGTATQEALEAKFVGMLRARPRDADLHHEFAFELERNGHLEPAIEHYSLATRLPPRAIGRAFLYRDLANALLRRGDVPGATAALRKSVVSWPVKGRGSCNATEVQLLGNVLEQSGALGDAMKYWRERMTLDPADEVCIAQYYRLLAKAKRLGEGLHDVEAAR